MSASNYKKKLSELRLLKQKASESAFERAKLMSEVFIDADFRADNPGADDFKLAEILDRFCDDLFVVSRGGALSLINLYKHFPDRERWLKGDIMSMYEEMLAAVKPDAEEDGMTRKRATMKELEEASDGRRRAETRADTLAAELERAQRRIAELTEENATLRGRVSAMEQMLNRLNVKAA